MKKLIKPFNVITPITRILGENPLFLMAVLGLSLLGGGVSVKADVATAAILLGALMTVAAVGVAVSMGKARSGEDGN